MGIKWGPSPPQQPLPTFCTISIVAKRSSISATAELLLNSLADNVRQFVISKQLESMEQVAEFADLHFELTKVGRDIQNGFGARKNSGKSRT